MCRHFFVMFALVLVLPGCTTRLAVSKVEPGKPETHVGIPHPMMYSRYEVKMSWQVSKCNANDIDLKIGAEFKEPATAPDPDNLFVIDPNSLSSPLKTSEVQVGYLASGAPASLNAKAEDRSAQVLAGIASIGAGLVKFSVLPTPVSMFEKEVKQNACSGEVNEALKALPKNNKAVEAAAAMLDARTSDLKELTDKLAVMGNNADEATKQALSKAIDALGAAKEKLDAAIKAQAKILKVITYTQGAVWPQSGSVDTGEFELPKHVFDRWINEKIVNPDDRSNATIHVSLRANDKIGLASKKEGPIRPELGIPIRQGAEGKISACAGKSCEAGGEFIGGRKDRILQLGSVYYLPCESRAFSSISCTYTLDDNGRLKSMGSASTKATAESLVGSINDVVKQATDAKQAKADAKTKQLQVETAYLKAVAERDAAEAAIAKNESLKSNVDAVAALKAQTEKLNAERALVEAELALAEAREKAAKIP